LIIKNNQHLLNHDSLNRFSKIDDPDIPNFGKEILKSWSIKEMENNLFSIETDISDYYLSEKFLNNKIKGLKSKLISFINFYI